jgi:hypothetical protein
MFKKHHVTTWDGHRIVARRQGEYSDQKVTITLNDGSGTPRYGGVEMTRWEAERLVEAIQEAVAAV